MLTNLDDMKERYPFIKIQEHWLTNKGEEPEFLGYTFRLDNFIYFYDENGKFLKRKVN